MDNYIVSARKYRPSTFRSVVGQKSLTTTLKNAIQSNKLAHAYLFCGPRGVGKTSCARIFAKTINCLSPTADGEACNACESCRAFNEQRSYNIHELDAASNNSVDDIRTLIDQVRIPPPIGKYKVFIIDEVHMLTTAAFNAFLKTLEEPPHHALFILATTEKHKVLPTILSRCQIYDFSRISIADMVEHLQYVSSQEGVTAEPEALNVIAQKADGGMRDALSIFDQVVSFTNGNITYQAVIDNLNVLDYEYYFRLTDAILSGNVRASLLILNEILGKGFDGQNIITGLAGHFRDLLVCRDESTLVLFEVGASIRERYKEMAKHCPDQFLFKAIELANTCDLNYRASRNKRLLLELTLIQLCQLTQVAVDDKKKALIEPIAGTNPSSQAVNSGQPQQPPQVPSATAVAGAPQVMSTHMPSSVPAPPPSTAPNPARRTARPMGISMKEIGVEKPKQQTVQQTTTTVKEVVTPFDNDTLVREWDNYTATIDKKVYLKNTMINCKPTLQENYYFEVAVHNPGQQEELINNAIHILPFLRQHLNNSRIQMRVRIVEGNEKHLAYTSTEKLELLMKINPTLGRLRDEFNLTLD
ncbi:DNA polymerase III subunit gamma/tau [Parabacteroides distasonis]|uniref:DNA polymerase III subunit gamma/tau n=1 Tax=Parabacteroides distasonis TaxID=823 RepID=UPI0018A07E5D|nr:DNA polymerase III subunit gamma/tau [Parabacteroides distasonis]MDB9154093.1 DNA polymerase III subunit gamma/tau [Parabacteroides distasonis]MDB9158149.1 DNA polymerase III subunit gamma/tau [Parabacteroides distasonis]MDB9166963.1 DNA polymerase III subunit gamma/tau [Parabacteroides distasonis]MDB9171434.1 DNA polymerase III subunit gamma/tau [Parabacteroides distasonis]MDB9197148.1 DNA polymerase III subunit gamma/tau [Parabacteroides distasonis]